MIQHMLVDFVWCQIEILLMPWAWKQRVNEGISAQLAGDAWFRIAEFALNMSNSSFGIILLGRFRNHSFECFFFSLPYWMEDSHFESFEFFFLKISSEEGFTVPESLTFQVMPILPVSRIFTDEELDEHQLGSLEVAGMIEYSPGRLTDGT